MWILLNLDIVRGSPLPANENETVILRAWFQIKSIHESLWLFSLANQLRILRRQRDSLWNDELSPRNRAIHSARKKRVWVREFFNLKQNARGVHQDSTNADQPAGSLFSVQVLVLANPGSEDNHRGSWANPAWLILVHEPVWRFLIGNDGEFNYGLVLVAAATKTSP